MHRRPGDVLRGDPPPFGGGDEPLYLAEPEETAAGGARILVVDDAPDFCLLLARALVGDGYTVEVATRGTAALQMIRSFQPDLLLLDAMLPEVHGFEICRKVKGSLSLTTLPVVMMSGAYRGGRFAEDVEVFGADDYLEKPFELDELTRRIEALLPGARRRRDEAPAVEHDIDLRDENDCGLPPAAPALYRAGPMLDLERLRAQLADSLGDRLRNPPPAPRLSRPPPPKTAAELAPFIDHTLLKADARAEDVRRICAEAKAHGFASVCVNAGRVALAARELAGAKPLPIAVVGFPLGATSTAAKAFEAKQAVADGAREIDMVLDVGALKDRDLVRVLDDVAAVVKAARPAPVKVILETGLLDDEEKAIASLLARVGGAAFVKTSTGFGPGGATAEDVALMRAAVGPDLGVKASGGVRTADDAFRMIAAGADRIGASASVAIVTGGR